MAFVAPNREAGRILYQGTMDRARGIAGAVNQFIDEGYRRQEEEKDFGTKLKVTEAAINTFIKPKAAEFGLTPADVEAFMKRSNDESTKQYANRLGGFLETTITTGKMNREMEQAKAQRGYTDALREQAVAAKAASDAATLDRQKQTQMFDRMRGVTKEYRDLLTMDREGAPMTIEQADRYKQLKNNQLIQSVAQGEELGLGAEESIKLFQNQDVITQRGEIERLKRLADDAERERRIAEAEAKRAAAANPPYGAKRTYTINGRTVNAISDGKDWVDEVTGMPINLRATVDQYGRPMYSNVPNPALFGTVPGLNTAMGAGGGGGGDMPGAGGMPSFGGMPSAGGTPAAGAPPPPAATKTFKTEQEAEAAYRAGKIKAGDLITVGGLQGFWQRRSPQ